MKPTITRAKNRLLNAIFFSLFLSLTFANPVLADNTSGPTVIQKIYNDLERLAKPSEAVEADFIPYLANYKYKEVAEQIIMRLQYELSYVDNLTLQSARLKHEIIKRCFAAMMEFINVSHQEALRKTLALAHGKYLPQIEPLLPPEEFARLSEEIDMVYDYLALQANKVKEPLPSLYRVAVEIVGPEVAKQLTSKLTRNLDEMKPMVIRAVENANALVPVQAQLSPEASLDDVHRVVEYLQRRVVDQPEAIERIKSIELTSRLYAGTTTKPTVVMLMGSPGTGKDTITKNWVDAVYNKENAFYDHLFVIPVMKTEADRWGIIGSTTGHIGSDSMPPFIRWLILHSGGRYHVEVEKSGTRAEFYIVENPDWKPGMVLPGFFSPDKAFVYADEFHNWSKDNKDSFVKQLMEKGYVQINNPGKGIDKIYVPFRFIIASNDGIGLVSSREANGQRYGAPLSYEEQLVRWERVHRDYITLKEELLKSNGAVNGRSGAAHPTGYSEEFVNRLPNGNLILMKPLSPEGIKKIAAMELGKFRDKLSASTVKVDLSWDQSVLDFVQSFDYIPEENARPVEFKVSNLVIDTLHGAISDGIIKPSNKSQKIVLSVVQNQDKTYTLKLTGDVKKDLPIKGTNHLKDAQPMTDAELQKWFDLEERLNKKVVGAQFVTKQLAREILLSQEGRNRIISEANAKESARVFMFLGPSSVGKTEMAKALATEVFGDVSVMKTFDAGRVTTKQHLEEMFLGMHDGLGNPVASRFMKEFDRNNGRLIVNLDEIANAPREVLKALYDIFREPVVRTFSDGKARVMTNVIFILTGNVGEEWYAQIPRNIPVEEQKAAMQEIYKEAMKSPGYRRMYLERYFSEALLARIGEDRIFFFSPLSEKSIRELSMMKLNQAIESLKPTPETRGWDVLFLNKAEYEKFLSVVEDEGFVLREQGASIDRAYKDTVFKALKESLIRGLAGNGKKVALFVKDVTEKNKHTGDPGDVVFGAYVEGQKEPLTFSMKRRARESTPQFTQETQITTAFHETGHELVRYALFHDVYETEKLTIIPGVAEISGSWIRYLGLVRYDESKYVEYSRNAVVRMMAISAGGYVAQQLVTRGAMDDAGKRNDMEHATWLARMAVMKWGLSKKWGTRSVPSDVSLQDYYASLPDNEKKVVESEVSIMVKEAEELARSVLLANYENGFIPLAMKLAEKGTIYGDEMAQFYKDNEIALYRESDGTFMKKAQSISLKSLVAKFSRFFPSSQKRDAELLPTLPRPQKIATIADVVKAQKVEQSAIVPDESKLPILKDKKGFETAFAAQGEKLSTKPALLTAPKKCASALQAVLKK